MLKPALRFAHSVLVKRRITRRYQRGLTRWVKQLAGCPDAYGDLFQLASRHKPVAILDVGCHIGKTIIRIQDNCKIPVHGFEPTPDTFEKVKARFENVRDVEIHNIALSDKTGTAEFFFNKNEQTNSLLDNDEGNRDAFGTYTEHVDRREITTMTLDDWCEKHLPSGNIIIKSDIQGAEGMLIKGGRKTLEERTIAILSEAQLAAMYDGQTDFFDLHRMLTDELGFALHNVYPCFHDSAGRALQTDAMWINERFLKS